MAWKDNALGITIDRTMDADYAALKAQGLAFVVIDAGTGFDVNPSFGDQYAKAVSAGLPVIAQYTPISAIDDYTFEAPAREQIPVLRKVLGTRIIQGLIISMERYWVGWDIEQGHIPVRTATSTAISYTASEFMNTFTKQYAPLGVQVMLRSNDNFVQKYALDMAQWTDKFGFVLADWRYRTRDANGAFTVYTLFPKTTISTLANLRAALPPDASKNPPVPGNAPQLKFWEFTGSVTMPLSLVKGWDGKGKSVKAAIFNGNDETMKAYLGVNNEAPANPPDPVDPGQPVSVDLAPVVEVLKGIAADVSAIRQDVQDIREVFRD